MAEPAIRLVWRKIDELIPYSGNAKLHPQEQIDRLVDSFDQFGRIVPAGIDAAGNLIYGHGRILAARQRGDTEFPCIEIDGLSEIQRRAFVHADNLLAQSPTDEAVLRGEMQALAAAGFDIRLTGYADAAIILDPPPEVKEDDVDLVLPETPKTSRGQLWQLGDHFLFCGDATSVNDVQACMGGGTGRPSSHGPSLWRGLYGHRQRSPKTPNRKRRQKGRGAERLSSRRLFGSPFRSGSWRGVLLLWPFRAESRRVLCCSA